jgi:hypothetical protein
MLVLRLSSTDLHKHWIGMRSNDLDVLIDDVLRLKPDVIGFSCYPWNVRLFETLSVSIKEVRPQIITIGGGPSVEYLRSSSGCDLLMEGEGEDRFPNLLKAVLGNHAFRIKEIPGLYVRSGQCLDWTGAALIPPDLNEAPSGLLYSSNLPRDIVSIETSRGCQFHCAFCSWGKGSRPRYFALERVFKELDEIASQRVERVFLSDSALNMSHQRADQILEYMIAHHNGVTRFSFELMMESLHPTTAKLIGELAIRGGVEMCASGLQSIEPEVLRAISRPCRVNSFEAKFAMFRRMAPAAPITLDVMFGLPRASLEGVLRTLEFCIKLGASRVDLFRCSVTPGSQMARTPGAYDISFQLKPPFSVTSSPYIKGDELCGFAVFALYWRQVAFRYGITLKLISLITGGRSATIAWDVFLQRRSALDPWPVIDLKGWDVGGFQNSLLEAYKQEVSHDPSLQVILAQVVKLDEVLANVWNQGGGNGRVLIVRAISAATSHRENDCGEFITLRNDLLTFLSTSKLPDSIGGESTVRVEQLKADQFQQLSPRNVITVLT